MPVITLANAKYFSSEANETLLEAACRAGILLEHSCKTGRCGSCRAKLAGGSTTAVADETGLTQAERDAGWVLTCARSAASNVQLEIEDLGDIQFYPAKTFPCRIRSLECLSGEIIRITLKLPPNQKLNYLPGQYVDVIGKDGVRRSYSVANAPASDKSIELHIRRVSGGAMSRYWFNEARIDDLLRLNGPLGTFFLRDVSGLDLILLATGTGIAPIKAMLEGLAAGPLERLPRSICVYWGGRVQQDLYWDPAETGLALRYIPVLSRGDSSWTGARGYVQQTVLKSGTNLEQAVVYACGSPEMIDSARAQLTAAGVNGRRFYSDAFVSSSENLKERS